MADLGSQLDHTEAVPPKVKEGKRQDTVDVTGTQRGQSGVHHLMQNGTEYDDIVQLSAEMLYGGRDRKSWTALVEP